MSIVVTAFVIQVSIAIVAFALREKVGQSVNQYLLKYYSSKSGLKVKVKFSHTRYRALGPELIPVYRQSARR